MDTRNQAIRLSILAELQTLNDIANTHSTEPLESLDERMTPIQMFKLELYEFHVEDALSRLDRVETRADLEEVENYIAYREAMLAMKHKIIFLQAGAECGDYIMAKLAMETA